MSPLADRWPLPGSHDLRQELLTAWDRPGYHGQRHLAEVLDRLDDLASAGARFDGVVVGLAAWFHDAVHDGLPGAEERSAGWALQALPDPPATEVARLVQMTERHRPAAHDRDGGALSDADLAILAAPTARYREYVADVRDEYSHLSDGEFRRGRRSVLLDLADKDPLFHTEHARQLWEAPARANLVREIAELG